MSFSLFVNLLLNINVCLPVCLRVYLCVSVFLQPLHLFAFMSWPLFVSVHVRRRGRVSVRVSFYEIVHIFTFGAVFNRMSSAERLCLVFVVDRMAKGLSEAFSRASSAVCKTQRIPLSRATTMNI